MITRVWSSEDDALKIVLSLHRRAPPSDEDWTEYIVAIESAMAACGNVPERVRGLSISDGGGPNAKQREMVKALLKRHGRSRGVVSIVTADPVGRGIIKALSWFNPDTRAFTPREMPEALDYLQLTPSQRAELELAVDAALIEYPIESMQPRRFEAPKTRSLTPRR